MSNVTKYRSDDVEPHPLRTVAAKVFAGITALVFLVAGSWGLVVVAQAAWALWGLPGVVIGFILFPIAIPVIPLIAGLKLAWWLPAILVYGGAVVAGIAHAATIALDDSEALDLPG